MDQEYLGQSLTLPMAWPRAWIRGLLLVCLAAASSARAEEPSVPVRLQASLLAKLAGYDRNLRARAGDRVRVAILIKPGDADSVRVGEQMSHALGQVGDIAGLPHDELSLDYTSAEALPQTCAAQRIAIVYVTPGFDGDAAKISQALRGADLLTVSAVARYVQNGIVVGFDALGGQPRMLIHLPQAKAQHVEFQAMVLKLMKVVE
jgi:hypothetical protein